MVITRLCRKAAEAPTVTREFMSALRGPPAVYMDRRARLEKDRSDQTGREPAVGEDLGKPAAMEEAVGQDPKEDRDGGHGPLGSGTVSEVWGAPPATSMVLWSIVMPQVNWWEPGEGGGGSTVVRPLEAVPAAASVRVSRVSPEVVSLAEASASARTTPWIMFMPQAKAGSPGAIAGSWTLVSV